MTTLVEVDSKDGCFPLAHLIRDADIWKVTDISDEIRRVRRNPFETIEGRRLERFAPLAGRIPGLPRLFHQVISRSTRMSVVSGTVAISSVGIFGRGSGHGIGFRP